jgi:methylated-DNA-[protein]-cysteine S-methyltransferase
MMTSFTKKVYQAVLTIPLGQRRSYKWVAEKAGRPKAARAVGQVLKRNPYPLLIPCHRVVGSRGEIGGYVWGKQVKRKLLDLEKRLGKELRKEFYSINRGLK